MRVCVCACTIAPPFLSFFLIRYSIDQRKSGLNDIAATTFSNRAVVVRYVCLQAVSVYFYVLVSCSGIVSYLSVYKIPPFNKLWFWEECVQNMFNCVSDDCLMFRSRQ